MGLSNENRVLIFWSILGAIAIFFIWYLPWRFQLNDDMIMMWLVRGDYTGRPESFVVFIHPILSWIFSKLYILIPQINWYPLTWFFIMYFSFLEFLILIWKKGSDLFLKTFLSLFLLAFVIHFLFFLQFSIVAAFSVSAGLTARGLRFLNDESVKDNKAHEVYSFRSSDLFILLGALIRIEVLFLFIAGLGTLGVAVFRKVTVIRALILPITLIVSLFLISQLYISLKGLDDFDRVNKLRSSVFDDPILQLRKETYRNSIPELYNFANGLIDFNRETDLASNISIWKKALDKNRLNTVSPDFILNALTYGIWHERFFCFLFILILGISLAFRFKKTLISILVLLLIMIILSPFFLLKIQVYVIILLVFFSSSIIFGSYSKPVGIISIPATAMLSIFFIVHFLSFFTSEKNLYPKEEFDTFEKFDSINLEKQNLFLVGMDQVNYHYIERKPLGIYYLGWPSLLFKLNENKVVYRVNRRVYNDNSEYFKYSKVLYKYPDYLDLIFIQ